MAVGTIEVRSQRYAIFNYLAVARLDHWFKNILILPGIGAAVLFLKITGQGGPALAIDLMLVARSVLVVLLACFVSSTNYIVNEVLDAPFDAKHPTKCHRPVPSGLVSVPLLLVMAGAFLAGAMAVATLVFPTAFVASLAALFAFGLIYNVPPVRAKELPYVDVLCESANNPIRMLIGWFGVGTMVLPPVSLLVCYWAIGGFLMTAKRYAELRSIDDPARAAAYRKSFKYYTSESLLLAMITYISAFMYCYGFISVRYKIELMFATPLVLGFIAWFFHLAFRKAKVVREPEKIIHEPTFMAYAVVTFVVVMACGLVDFDWLWGWLNGLHIGVPIG